MHMMIFVGYLLVGVVAGLASGLVGIGGGSIVVPCLVFIFSYLSELPANNVMHFAAGTSFAIMMVTISASLLSHARRGATIWPVYRRLAAGIVVGTICGALIASFLHSYVLRIIFGLVLLVLATRLIVAKETKPTRQLPRFWGSNAVAWLIGVKSGLLGVGGGMVSVPFLTYCNVPMRDAVGISAACGLTIAVVGAISVMFTGAHVVGAVPWGSGFIYWPAVLGVALTSPLFANVGARWSQRLPVPVLKRVLAVLMLLIALKMLL